MSYTPTTRNESARYPYLLERTRFHDGSRHRTEAAAEHAGLKDQGECTCGCVGVVRAEDYDALPHSDGVGHYSEVCQ